ncbi:MAG TPA: hypothetical protein VFU47_14865, partial [Armatimonadota bacterium]|nr:hypothetical protein [Armatimonadota bacterium]
GWRFVGLDTTQGSDYEETLVPEATLEWLDRTLPEIGRAEPLILFTHFPLGEGVRMRPRNADAVLERFTGHDLRAVLCGHYHGWTERSWRGVPIGTGPCCSPTTHNHDGSPEKGFTLCRVEDGRVTRIFVPV